MRLTEAQYELIEAYLNNELSDIDRVAFENEIQADAELQAEVNRQRDIRLGLQALGIQRALERAKMQYKGGLSTAELRREEERTLVQPLIGWRYWAAAASVVLVFGIGYYAYQQTASRQADIAYSESFPSTSTDELMKNFPSENVPLGTRTAFLDAFKNYKAGKYDQVIEQLRIVPTDKQTIHYKNYLLGLSYLANKQPTEAIPLLSKAMNTSSPELHKKAEWFLALAFVKNNQKERALPILKRISIDKTHPFQSLSQQIIKKIQ